jgi:hypothetical protein
MAKETLKEKEAQEEERAAKAFQSLKELGYDPFDLEFDRFNSNELNLLDELYVSGRNGTIKNIEYPVDLSLEMDNMSSAEEVEKLLDELKQQMPMEKPTENTKYDDEM